MGNAEKIFVNSMRDLFHKDVPEAYIRQVCEVMRKADWHTFQVLTKSDRNECVTCSTALWRSSPAWGNVWWGV